MKISKNYQWSIIAVLTCMSFTLTAQEKSGNTSEAALEMILFEGDFDDKFIEVKWAPKAKPEQIKEYLVEYSKDGVNYRQIGTVSPDLKNIYEYKSIIYQAGTNYFRIVQVDKAGNELISERVNVMCGFPDRYQLDLENVDNKLKVRLQVRTTQRVYVELLTPDGDVKKSLYSGEMEQNEMIFRTVDFADLDLGNYYLSIRGQTFRMSKEIKLK